MGQAQVAEVSRHRQAGRMRCACDQSSKGCLHTSTQSTLVQPNLAQHAALVLPCPDTHLRSEASRRIAADMGSPAWR